MNATGRHALRRARVRDLALLQQISRLALEASDLPSVCSDIIHLMMEAGRFDLGVIRLLDAERRTLQVIAGHGVRYGDSIDLPPVGSTDPVTGRRLNQVVVTRKARVEEDVPSAEGFSWAKREGLRSIIVVPLAVEDEVLGTLTMGSRRRRRFPPTLVELLRAAGGQVGLAIQKMRLYEEAKALGTQMAGRLQELDILYNTAQLILGSPDTNAVLDQVLGIAMDASGMDLGSIRRLDHSGPALVPLAHRGYRNPQAIFDRGADLSRNPIVTLLEAVDRNTTLVITNIQEREGMRVFKQEGAEVAVAVPLRAGADVIGAMYLASRTPKEITPHELRLLEAIGAQVGLAIEKARLHQETVDAYAELKQAEASLRESEERYRAVVENMGDGVAILVEGRRVFVNQAFLDMHGLTDPSQAIGHPASSLVVPEEREMVRERMRAVDAGELSSIASEVHTQGADGRIRTMEAILTRITYQDRPATMSIIRDVTRRKQMEAEIVHLADHDPLTGLLNRRRFEEDLRRCLASPGRGGLLYIDLDNFKEINDSYGHPVGDLVLKSLAGVLMKAVREADGLARVGGDEFAVLMPGARAADAEAAAARIIGAVQDHRVPFGETNLRVTASIGIALFPEHGSSGEGLLVHADQGMYRAKEEGRNRWEMYQQAADESPVPVRMARNYRLRDALRASAFFFEAQPILDLRSNAVFQYELLLRLNDGSGQALAPHDFLGPAERLGLTREIDRWVSGEAIEVLAALRKAARPVALEVNLSARALADDQLMRLIQGACASGRIDPHLLIFEITESEAVADVTRARAFMERLRGIGCRFALDDFGVGFSSFSHLRHLPVDYLKIDGSFVVDLVDDATDRELVRAMVHVAHALGVETIAESVENVETLQLLRDLDVDYAQGFLVGPPRPMDELLTAQGCR